MGKKIKINFKIFTNQFTLMFICIFFVSIVGATYAYFAIGASNNNTITGNAATVDLTLEVNKLLPLKASSGYIVPQKSVSGSSNSPLSTALKSGCVDANNNIVCQVYSIDIKNDGGTATEVVDGKISFYANSSMTINSFSKMPNLKWKLITSIDTVNNNNSILGDNIDNIANSTAVNFVSNVTLATNQHYTYYMIIWLNEVGSDQSDEGNTFYGKVEFNSSNGTGVTSTF